MARERMRALAHHRYGPADLLRIEDVERPEPKDHQVLVRVRAAAVDPSVWHQMTGEPYLVRVMGYGVRKPKRPSLGGDFAGTIVALGTNVSGFDEGDDVFGVCAGSLADYAVARATKIWRKPANLTFEEAAAVPISGTTALQALRDKGRVQPGEHVSITGATGGVGTFAVQLAKAFGARVTAVCSTEKMDLARSLGADDVVDYTREDFADGPRRFDLIVDIAGTRSLSDLRRALTPRGRLVIVGSEGGGRVLGPLGRSLRATALSPFVPQKLSWFVAGIKADDLDVLERLIEEGKVKPVIDRTYPLEDAAAAIAYQQQGHARGKVVVSVRPQREA